MVAECAGRGFGLHGAPFEGVRAVGSEFVACGFSFRAWIRAQRGFGGGGGEVVVLKIHVSCGEDFWKVFL